MKRRPPPEVREMYTVFEELFYNLAAQFYDRRPEALQCRIMLQETITLLRSYEESLGELLAQRASITRHEALPRDTPLRIPPPQRSRRPGLSRP